MLAVNLLRAYGDRGTNGEIWIGDGLVCYTIELPWHENVRNISCIPEGTYPLAKGYSKRFGWHILVRDVPMRSAILIHPANNAQKELRGCIAPVSELTGEGKGIRSRVAFEKLKEAVYAALDQGQQVILIIERKEKE